MSDLKSVTSRRKAVRKKVTVSYDKRDSYSVLSADMQTTERGLLLSYQNSLMEFDKEFFYFAELKAEESEIYWIPLTRIESNKNKT